MQEVLRLRLKWLASHGNFSMGKFYIFEFITYACHLDM